MQSYMEPTRMKHAILYEAYAHETCEHRLYDGSRSQIVAK